MGAGRSAGRFRFVEAGVALRVTGLGAGTWVAVLVLASLSAATGWIGVVLALRLGDRPAAVAGGIT